MNPLLIVGCHTDAVEEAEKASLLIANECDYLAVGKDAVKLKFNWKYVATYHKEDLVDILSQIDKRKLIDCQIISHEKAAGVDVIIPFEKPSGSSALLGALAGIQFGYTKMILCGCPLEGGNNKGHLYNQFRIGWEKKKIIVESCVRSMSGWTKNFLGSPSLDWLVE